MSWQRSREKMDRHIHLCIYIYTYTNISNKWSELEVTGQRAGKGLEKQSTGVSKMAYAKGRSKEGIRKPQSGLAVPELSPGGMPAQPQPGRGHRAPDYPVAPASIGKT